MYRCAAVVGEEETGAEVWRVCRQAAERASMWCCLFCAGAVGDEKLRGRSCRHDRALGPVVLLRRLGCGWCVRCCSSDAQFRRPEVCTGVPEEATEWLR